MAALTLIRQIKEAPLRKFGIISSAILAICGGLALATVADDRPAEPKEKPKPKQVQTPVEAPQSRQVRRALARKSRKT